MITGRIEHKVKGVARACEILKQVFRDITPYMTPGRSASEINQLVEDGIRRRSAKPAFLGFPSAEGKPFPASVCISIDAEVVHGIPNDRIFSAGQIVGLDIGVELDGFYGDAARTFLIGEVGEPIRRLVQVTRESLDRGIQQARKNARLSDISYAIQSWAEKHGYSVVRELSGHGIGTSLHEEPQVPNHGLPGRGVKLTPGMILAIEPMINLGGREVYTASDGWTVITKDGLPSAHWEETIAITDGAPLILTRENGEVQS
ncbi:MAG: type I methionyl aminopeptidase [bacterium]